MNQDELITILDLPSSCRVDQRVPKKLLLENGTPAASDKRVINEGLEELYWLAALKPTTIGVPEFIDDNRAYLEIAVLYLTTKSSAKFTRIVELIHRAIPYPLLLLTQRGNLFDLSAAHKRWSHGETEKTVLEDNVITTAWEADEHCEPLTAFFEAMQLGKQPRTTLFALYQGWIDTLLALQAARRIGIFTVPTSAEHAKSRHQALIEYAKLDTDIARTRATAAKEKQLSRRVALNLELKRLETAQAVIREEL